MSSMFARAKAKPHDKLKRGSSSAKCIGSVDVKTKTPSSGNVKFIKMNLQVGERGAEIVGTRRDEASPALVASSVRDDVCIGDLDPPQISSLGLKGLVSSCASPLNLDGSPASSGSTGKEEVASSAASSANVGASQQPLVGSSTEESASDYSNKDVPRLVLDDTRAKRILVVPINNNFYVCPSTEEFSGHTGTCRIMGSKKCSMVPLRLETGIFLRLGSVGFVVAEINTGNPATSSKLEEKELEALKQQTMKNHAVVTPRGIFAVNEDFKDCEDLEDSATDVDDGGQSLKPFCYICYDASATTPENPLISPCLCKGDTKHVHLNCLKRWCTNSGASSKICSVISPEGLSLCSICKSPYQTNVKLKTGDIVSLQPGALPGPSVTLVVVTNHESSMQSSLTHTRFQLSFASLLHPDGSNGTRPLTIGRSSTCDMVLRYRTVSTTHAQVLFEDGAFYIIDRDSSNGTLLYLNKPLKLPPGEVVHIKNGRTLVSMRFKKPFRFAFSSLMRKPSDGDLSSLSIKDGQYED